MSNPEPTIHDMLERAKERIEAPIDPPLYVMHPDTYAAMAAAEDVDLTKPYVWSTTRRRWVNSGCSGCEFHVPDASPETTALIRRLDAELARPT